ncbi:hypothetical protein [Chitinophaga sp. HK235]|uniref:hypothetical protein n=1 Tax=Chitinophaga sp. HK235 TaxID=2952571 RepID=UPI001BA9E78C|nr:hypothetical protein [Chitinophaga sp. HK235]
MRLTPVQFATLRDRINSSWHIMAAVVLGHLLYVVKGDWLYVLVVHPDGKLEHLPGHGKYWEDEIEFINSVIDEIIGREVESDD